MANGGAERVTLEQVSQTEHTHQVYLIPRPKKVGLKRPSNGKNQDPIRKILLYLFEGFLEQSVLR